MFRHGRDAVEPSVSLALNIPSKKRSILFVYETEPILSKSDYGKFKFV